jgi:single-strand DNA-binding protein
MLNQVLLIGHMGQDPQLKQLPNGTVVAKFSLAVNRSFKANNQWQNQTDWISITCFAKQATDIGQHGHKGLKLLVQGHLKATQYETKSGFKVKEVFVVADKVHILPKMESQDVIPGSLAQEMPDAFDQELPKAPTAWDDNELPF